MNERYICSICKEAFESLEVLKSHIKEKKHYRPGSAGFECAVCHQVFETFELRKNHVKETNHHINPIINGSKKLNNNEVELARMASMLKNTYKKRPIIQPQFPGDVSANRENVARSMNFSNKKISIKRNAYDFVDFDEGRHEDDLCLCFDMCPASEREARGDRVGVFEKIVLDGIDVPLVDSMIKRLEKSAADRNLFIPEQIRTPRTILKTIKYIENCIQDAYDQNQSLSSLAKMQDSDRKINHHFKTKNVSALEVYDFVADRYRMISKDFIMMNPKFGYNIIWIECHERMARWYIYMSYRMLQPEVRTEFDQRFFQHNREALNNCLKNLMSYYKGAYRESLYLPNKGEFTSYFLLLQAGNANVVENILRTLTPDYFESPWIQFALEIWKSLKMDNYVRFFHLYESANVLQSCLLLRYIAHFQQLALRLLLRTTLNRRNAKPIPLVELQERLYFETVEDVESFLTDMEIPIGVELDGTKVLDISVDFKVMGNLKPIFRSSIELKRGEYSVRDISRGLAVIEDETVIFPDEKCFSSVPKRRNFNPNEEKSASSLPVGLNGGLGMGATHSDTSTATSVGAKKGNGTALLHPVEHSNSEGESSSIPSRSAGMTSLPFSGSLKSRTLSGNAGIALSAASIPATTTSTATNSSTNTANTSSSASSSLAAFSSRKPPPPPLPRASMMPSMTSSTTLPSEMIHASLPSLDVSSSSSSSSFSSISSTSIPASSSFGSSLSFMSSVSSSSSSTSAPLSTSIARNTGTTSSSTTSVASPTTSLPSNGTFGNSTAFNQGFSFSMTGDPFSASSVTQSNNANLFGNGTLSTTSTTSSLTSSSTPATTSTSFPSTFAPSVSSFPIASPNNDSKIGNLSFPNTNKSNSTVSGNFVNESAVSKTSFSETIASPLTSTAGSTIPTSFLPSTSFGTSSLSKTNSLGASTDENQSSFSPKDNSVSSWNSSTSFSGPSSFPGWDLGSMATSSTSPSLSSTFGSASIPGIPSSVNSTTTFPDSSAQFSPVLSNITKVENVNEMSKSPRRSVTPISVTSPTLSKSPRKLAKIEETSSFPSSSTSFLSKTTELKKITEEDEDNDEKVSLNKESDNDVVVVVVDDVDDDDDDDDLFIKLKESGDSSSSSALRSDDKERSDDDDQSFSTLIDVYSESMSVSYDFSDVMIETNDMDVEIDCSRADENGEVHSRAEGDEKSPRVRCDQDENNRFDNNGPLTVDDDLQEVEKISAEKNSLIEKNKNKHEKSIINAKADEKSMQTTDVVGKNNCLSSDIAIDVCQLFGSKIIMNRLVALSAINSMCTQCPLEVHHIASLGIVHSNSAMGNYLASFYHSDQQPTPNSYIFEDTVSLLGNSDSNSSVYESNNVEICVIEVSDRDSSPSPWFDSAVVIFDEIQDISQLWVNQDFPSIRNWLHCQKNIDFPLSIVIPVISHKSSSQLVSVDVSIVLQLVYDIYQSSIVNKKTVRVADDSKLWSDSRRALFERGYDIEDVDLSISQSSYSLSTQSLLSLLTSMHERESFARPDLIAQFMNSIRSISVLYLGELCGADNMKTSAADIVVNDQLVANGLISAMKPLSMNMGSHLAFEVLVQYQIANMVQNIVNQELWGVDMDKYCKDMIIDIDHKRLSSKDAFLIIIPRVLRSVGVKLRRLYDELVQISSYQTAKLNCSLFRSLEIFEFSTLSRYSCSTDVVYSKLSKNSDILAMFYDFLEVISLSGSQVKDNRNTLSIGSIVDHLQEMGRRLGQHQSSHAHQTQSELLLFSCIQELLRLCEKENGLNSAEASTVMIMTSLRTCLLSLFTVLVDSYWGCDVLQEANIMLFSMTVDELVGLRNKLDVQIPWDWRAEIPKRTLMTSIINEDNEAGAEVLNILDLSKTSAVGQKRSVLARDAHSNHRQLNAAENLDNDPHWNVHKENMSMRDLLTELHKENKRWKGIHSELQLCVREHEPMALLQ